MGSLLNGEKFKFAKWIWKGVGLLNMKVIVVCSKYWVLDSTGVVGRPRSNQVSLPSEVVPELAQ